ncbi:prolyl oligopeptidase family protein [Orientia chuto str. Dubai]|uniref:Prolyl oligopeptidase family protein n=1 Tax=Orientia chuto str. Dubai TaxID=1359168 RepID=A0A0F3MP99_9RICK|nr:alpha/beta hydrolase [Candidatus Orientia mediorientalis]KJV57282.1 prolyl oligopeptidase family protein [Orientia chuto str. Dubai]
MSEVFFNGPAGRIEGKYIQSDNPRAPVALILHPHLPSDFFEGNMNHEVINCLYSILIKNGFSALKINFRGIGKSQGTFDNGVGELMDAATALDWLQLHNPSSLEYLAVGFSFGAWICMQLIMRRPEINNFIAISPPTNKFDFSFLSPCPIPGLIIQGEQDSIVPEESVLELVNRLSRQKNINIEYKLLSGADHFFRGKLNDLSNTVDEYIKISHHSTGKKNASKKHQNKLLL